MSWGDKHLHPLTTLNATLEGFYGAKIANSYHKLNFSLS